MKGIIFNLFEQAVVAAHGQDTWEGLLEAAELDGAYTSIGSYPDKELFALVSEGSRRLGQDEGETLRWFGRQALPLLASAYPEFFSEHRSTIPFLLTLNDVIHAEVLKLYPGADVPTFDFDDCGDHVLALGYHSSRGLCALAEGLVEGAAGQFGEEVAIEQTECTHRGAERCVLVCSFTPAAGGEAR